MVGSADASWLCVNWGEVEIDLSAPYVSVAAFLWQCYRPKFNILFHERKGAAGYRCRFIMKFDWTTILGVIAAICTTCSFFPQVIKILKSKRTNDVSFLMYAILSTGLFLWLIYGFLLMDFPLIFANTISLTLAMCVLVLKIRHG